MAFPNLAAEMVRCNVDERDLVNATGKTIDTVKNWMKGKTSIPIRAAFVIRDSYFPGMSIEYLFSDTAITPTEQVKTI